MSLLKELTVPLFFSLVLALAAFALIVTECVLISRASKKIREQDGEGVLRETGRMGWALAGICVCWTAGYLLFDYGVGVRVCQPLGQRQRPVFSCGRRGMGTPGVP